MPVSEEFRVRDKSSCWKKRIITEQSEIIFDRKQKVTRPVQVYGRLLGSIDSTIQGLPSPWQEQLPLNRVEKYGSKTSNSFPLCKGEEASGLIFPHRR